MAIEENSVAAISTKRIAARQDLSAEGAGFIIVYAEAVKSGFKMIDYRPETRPCERL